MGRQMASRLGFRGSRNSLMKKGTEEGIPGRIWYCEPDPLQRVHHQAQLGCSTRVGRREGGVERVQRDGGPSIESYLYAGSGEESMPHVFERW